MIHFDVNVLVYAFRIESPDHDRCRGWLDDVRVSREEIGLGELALTGFVRIVTNPRAFVTPAPTSAALQFVDSLRATPKARTVTATAASWRVFYDLAANDPQIRANLVPDAWLAALAISHDARLATTDRGFARFPGLELVDPRTKS